MVRFIPQVILKHKLLLPILSVVFPIMATGEDAEEENDEDGEELADAGCSRPSAVAAQV